VRAISLISRAVRLSTAGQRTRDDVGVPRRARTETIAVGPFIAALDARLGGMSGEELRGVVLTFAQSMDPAERQGFLERFGASLVRPGDEIGALLADLELLEEPWSWSAPPGIRTQNLRIKSPLLCR
jgi:hypothetical protein